MLYSFNGSEPQELPNRIKFPGGRTHYLSDSPLSQEELEEAGWSGPFAKPGFVLGEENVKWDEERGSYQVVKLDEEEKEKLWAAKSADNARNITELRDIALNQKQQLEALGLSVDGIDQFLSYLATATLPGNNPFTLRIPPLSLLGATSKQTELNDPFTDWLIKNFQSDLAHGYHVEGNQLQVRDEQAFEAYKRTAVSQFLAEYIEANNSAVSFASQITDSFNGTGEVLVKAYGDYEELSIELDGKQVKNNKGVVEVVGSGNHKLRITPLTDGASCGNTDIFEFSLI